MDGVITYKGLKQGAIEVNPMFLSFDKDTSLEKILFITLGTQFVFHIVLKSIFKKCGMKNPAKYEVYGRSVVIGWNLTQVKIRW